MTLRLALILSAFLLSFLPPEGKKEQLLKLSKQYFPENYAVLKTYDESSISSIAEGNSVENFSGKVPTIVHEAYHHHFSLNSSYHQPVIVYRINDTLSFSVNRFSTFPSIRLNTIVPASTRKKIFRYATYINEKNRLLVTQQYGLLGLMEEAVAYYQSLHTAIALFNYYIDRYGWEKPQVWMDYLGNIASYRYALTEFELFISWYMQYAKLHHPDIYKDIYKNKPLKELALFLHQQNALLAARYDQNRSEILNQFNGRLAISDNFIRDTKTGRGNGLYDNEVAEMQALLNAPEHKDYLEFISK